MERHCDEKTMDHIIELRKRLMEAENHRDNALNACMALRKEIEIARLKLEKYGDFSHEEDRNC